jgi:hypothetical protein
MSALKVMRRKSSAASNLGCAQTRRSSSASPQISNDSLNAYRNARQDLTIITRNGKIGGARRILKLAAEVWCYPNTNMTWLERAPSILAEKGHRPRDPYPLDASEQELLFSELTADRRRIALFAVTTGLRDQELGTAPAAAPRGLIYGTRDV